MKQTPNYNLPQFEVGDKFNKETLNEGYSKIDLAISDLQETFNANATGSALTTQEVVEARKGKETLKEKINEIEADVLSNKTQMDNNMNKENWINVMDYGAKCDGVTDDSEAFQKAINALNVKQTPKGQWKRVLYVPAVMRVDSDTPITTTFGQFKIQGNYLNNSKIIFTKKTGGLVINTTNNFSFEVEINDLNLDGNNICDNLLTFNKTVNIYLKRVHFEKWSVNGYALSFNDSGIIFTKELVINGGVPTSSNKAILNGVKINNASMFKGEGYNTYNLNRAFTLETKVLNFEYYSSWTEHVKNVVYINPNSDDLRYTGISLHNNTFDNGTYTTLTNFSLIDFNTTSTTNIWNSFIDIKDNYIYLPTSATLYNDTLININDCLAESVVFITFKGNHYANFSLNGINGYIFKLNDITKNKINSFRIIDVNVLHDLDFKRITDIPSIIKSVSQSVNGKGYLTAPNGLYLTNNSSSFGDGNIYYENGEFYAGYSGTIKTLPKASGTSINYSTATDVATIKADFNTLITALKTSKIIN